MFQNFPVGHEANELPGAILVTVITYIPLLVAYTATNVMFVGDSLSDCHSIERYGHYFLYQNVVILAVSSVLDISARPLAQASVKSVGRVQIRDHSPAWQVQFSSPRNYLKIKIKHDFTLHFGKKIPHHKLTISTLQSFVFRRQVTYYIRLNNMASL